MNYGMFVVPENVFRVADKKGHHTRHTFPLPFQAFWFCPFFSLHQRSFQTIYAISIWADDELYSEGERLPAITGEKTFARPLAHQAPPRYSLGVGLVSPFTGRPFLHHLRPLRSNRTNATTSNTHNTRRRKRRTLLDLKTLALLPSKGPPCKGGGGALLGTCSMDVHKTPPTHIYPEKRLEAKKVLKLL